MADKKGAGSDTRVTGQPAAKKSEPRKGARSAGETTPPRTGSTAGDANSTAETGAGQKSSPGSKGASSRAGTAKKGAAGGSRTAAAGGGKGPTGGPGKATKAANSKGAPDLKKDLRDYAAARPDGWSHEDWLRFLDDLKARGHNINDRDAIGSMLERERLAIALERIPGVGPQRVRSIADRYGYLWRLRETDADQLAREANVPKQVAEKVVDALRP